MRRNSGRGIVQLVQCSYVRTLRGVFFPHLLDIVLLSSHFRQKITSKPSKMKLAIAALLAGSAAAFAPVAQKASSTSLKMAFETELGVQAPLGFYVSTELTLVVRRKKPHDNNANDFN